MEPDLLPALASEIKNSILKPGHIEWLGQLAYEDVNAEPKLGTGRQVKMQLHKMQIFTPLHTHQAQLGELSPTIFHP